MKPVFIRCLVAAAILCCTLAAFAQEPTGAGPPAGQKPQTETTPPAVPKPPAENQPPAPGKAAVPQPPPKPPLSPLAQADELYHSARYADAEAAYRALLDKDPKLVAAQAGLIKSLLRQEKIDDARATATADLAAEPNAAPLLAAMGDVQYRFGEMSPAEKSYIAALKADRTQVSAYIGLARLYRAYSLYRHAYDVLQLARQANPNDPEVQRMLIRYLSRPERIAALKAYLADAHPEDPEETDSLRVMLDFLQETQGQPAHNCRLVSKVEQTETKLETLYASAQRIGGFGLNVKLNDHTVHMMLDTGANGILVGRKTAEKAGLKRIASEHMMGIGDKGVVTGYTAVADHIRIGELEFEDCIVDVTDKASVTEEQGLVGADVFSAYLIDINLPEKKLRLSPLPRRPDEAAAPTALNTDESTGASEEKNEPPADKSDKNDKSKTAKDDGKKANADKPATPPLPKDRYIAPEMANWTRIFRFGHELLIPTWVNNSPPLLFLIDTGSFGNMLSIRAARQVTTVADEPDIEVRGISGAVKKVYTGHKATLTFSRFQQKNQEIVTIDLSGLCRSAGTEVSGVLGFDVLRQLETKIDYRDGLVDFVNPKAPPPTK